MVIGGTLTLTLSWEAGLGGLWSGHCCKLEEPHPACGREGGRPLLVVWWPLWTGCERVWIHYWLRKWFRLWGPIQFWWWTFFFWLVSSLLNSRHVCTIALAQTLVYYESCKAIQGGTAYRSHASCHVKSKPAEAIIESLRWWYMYAIGEKFSETAEVEALQ